MVSRHIFHWVWDKSPNLEPLTSGRFCGILGSAAKGKKDPCRKGVKMEKLYFYAKKNQVPYCIAFWVGPAIYAGQVANRETFSVFPVSDEADARANRACVLGRFDSVAALIKALRRCGGYKVVGREMIPASSFHQESKTS
jgi:hypothetical protein